MHNLRRLAILGASSQIARDLIKRFLSHQNFQILMYVRNIKEAKKWQSLNDMRQQTVVHTYEEYGLHPHDVVINCIGVGDPKKAIEMGASILEITANFDDLILKYLSQNQNRRYLFLSSGAVYGDNFLEPVHNASISQMNINHITPLDYYATAKLHAEVKHRAQTNSPIIDLRVFNYFSRTQNMDARFLITDIVRAIRNNQVLKTSPDNIWRDFLHPKDFYQLVCCIIESPPNNCAIDCYSSQPIDKMALLKEIKENFGLQYEITRHNYNKSINATGVKPNYYSTNMKAADFGYEPSFSSLSGILYELNSIFN
jgi:nucleoside-diphosphate-sugar epimerase